LLSTYYDEPVKSIRAGDIVEISGTDTFTAYSDASDNPVEGTVDVMTTALKWRSFSPDALVTLTFEEIGDY
jgi:hypothetical protein